MPNQLDGLLPISCIDNLDIPDKTIENCKISYESLGKEAAYKTLNECLYNDKPSQTERNLFLYRKAMYLSKKAFHLGEGYVEKELVIGQDNGFNIVSTPLWKRRKWSFLDRDANIKIRNVTGRGYNTKSQFKLDDYGNTAYDTHYGDETKLSMKKRGGASVVRRTRFDFEYKYSVREYYNKQYLRYIYNTFRRVLFAVCKHGVYNLLPPEEAAMLYTILGLIPNDIKLNIVKNIVDYILYEKQNNNSDNPNYGEEDVLVSFQNFLSELHDTLLLPFEFTCYLMCALITPRYEAIIEDSKGNVGTYVLGGDNTVFPETLSSLGPSIASNSLNTVSVVIPNIEILENDGGIALFETLFIYSDQEYNIKCYSYNKNAFLTNIPLLNKDAIPYIDKAEPRTLLTVIPSVDEKGDSLVWFIYSDYIITYNVSSHEWITSQSDDPNHLVGFDITSLFPQGNTCIFASYDKNNEILIFIDNIGNIASYDILAAIPSPYNNNDAVNPDASIHFDISLNPEGIIDFKRLIILDTEDDYTVFGFNDRICQIITYKEGGTIVKNKQYDFYDGSPIVDVIKLDDEKKMYIVFENHKIIELATYLYIPTVFQNKADSSSGIISAGKSLCNVNDTPIYITRDNKIHILHPIYNIKNRVSVLTMPIEKYVAEGAHVARYKEHFIDSSSISVFSNPYYALADYFDYLKHPLTGRT
jgi:hypothetical protein